MNELTRQGISEVVEGLGYDLVQLERAGSARRPILRLRIDRPEGVDGGVTVDDCARASRAVEAWLEEAQHVPQTYVLEVSSPGLDRPLTRPRDWKRFAGRRAAVKLGHPGNHAGRRVEGTILEPAAEPAAVRLALDDGTEIELDLDQVEKAHLVHSWDPRG